MTTMYRIFMFAALWLLTSGRTFCQSLSGSQERIPLKSDKVIVIAVEAHGIVLLDLEPRVSNNQLGLTTMLYDTAWSKKWETSITVQPGFNLVLYQYLDERLYFVFADKRRARHHVIQLEMEGGYFQSSIYNLSQGFRAMGLQASREFVWISGTIKDQGIIFRLNPGDNSSKILPVGHASPVTQIASMHYDPEQRELMYCLSTSFKQLDTYIFRKVNTDGKVLQNVVFQSDQAVRLSDLKMIPYPNKTLCVGFFSKGQSEKPKGLFIYEIGDVGIKQSRLLLFKEMTGQEEYVTYEAIASNANGPVKKKTRKDMDKVVLDNVIDGDGGTTLVLEAVKKSYKTKGYLQREIEKQQIVNEIDQNAYRRRDFDLAGQGQSIEDRIDNYSGTAIQQYMYREAIVSQPEFRGYAYDRTLIIRIGEDLSFAGVEAISMPNFGHNFVLLTNSSVQENGIGFTYADESNLNTVRFDEKQQGFMVAGQSGNKASNLWWTNWYASYLLGYRLFSEGEQPFLHVEKASFR